MDSERTEGLSAAAHRALAWSSTAAAAWVTALAASHMMMVSRWGPICGASASAPVHCWACYAAPSLVGAALLAWWMTHAHGIRAHVCR